MRALFVALLAASLSYAGAGTVALASAPDALVQQAREGKGDQPFVARPEAVSARLTFRVARSVLDAGTRPLTAALAALPSLAPSPVGRALVARDAERTARLLPVTVRSSRGPPAA